MPLPITTHWPKLIRQLPQWGQEVQSQHDPGQGEVETYRE